MHRAQTRLPSPAHGAGGRPPPRDGQQPALAMTARNRLSVATHRLLARSEPFRRPLFLIPVSLGRGTRGRRTCAGTFPDPVPLPGRARLPPPPPAWDSLLHGRPRGPRPSGWARPDSHSHRPPQRPSHRVIIPGHPGLSLPMEKATRLQGQAPGGFFVLSHAELVLNSAQHLEVGARVTPLPKCRSRGFPTSGWGSWRV